MIDLSKAVVLRERDGRVDFHWWQDPRNVGAAALKIRDELIKRDADGSRPYRAAAARYRTKLERLDHAASRCMREVLGGVRKLFTAHEAFGYFAARYRLEDAGAVIDGRISPTRTSLSPSMRLDRRRIRASASSRSSPSTASAASTPHSPRPPRRPAFAPVTSSTGTPSAAPNGRDARYVGAFAHDTQAIAHGLGVPPSNCPLPRWP